MMILMRSRRWLYALLALWFVVILSLFNLFLSYESASADEHPEHMLPANAETVHWKYFSQTLESLLTVDSSDAVIVETVTRYANRKEKPL